MDITDIYLLKAKTLPSRASATEQDVVAVSI